MKCCGKERGSPFCPECGTKLADGPAGEILLNLGKRLADVEKRIERWSKGGHGPKARDVAMAAKLKRWIDWVRWVDWVSENAK